MRFKKKLKKLLLLTIFCSAFVIPLLGSFLLIENAVPINETGNQESFIEIQPKVAGYWFENNISIDDTGVSPGSLTWAEATAYPWCSGDGSWNNPYTIENVTINGQNSTDCIKILDSIVYFKIKNCTLFNASESFKAGISLSNASNGFLIDNNCSYNGYYGISLDGSKNNTLKGNLCDYNLQSGITLLGFDIPITQYSDDNKITGNSFSHNLLQGIMIDNCKNNIIANNNCSDNVDTGIYLTDCYNNTLTSNTCSDNDVYGIGGQNSNKTDCIGNTVNFNLLTGIFLQDCNGSEIFGNTINNNGHSVADFDGLYIGSDDCIITNNTCNSNAGIGLYINGEDNKATVNNCSDNDGTGLKIRGNGNNGTVNICNGNYHGIMLDGNNNNISMNTCNNSFIGILIQNGIANKVTFNTISYEADCIVDLGSGTIKNNNTCIHISNGENGGPPNGGGEPPVITGIDTFILIGTISIVFIILMKRRYKRIVKS